ncbi:type VII secretion system-associated protein [Winogradskya humida]|uniref:Type VII secretion system-associated protein n=1 Tax=Winogradskya humida TaxID=113566 RepID=A0ABQ3ZTA0_9ACTN|nr:type VII secretion system-associated protein [Actinoplanes humidus]GIE21810.1 hypothetical protein Ahu01nite_049120 [Actinoplanes humidus]
MQPYPPGTWVYAIDPAYGGTEDVPPFAISGAYAVDENGVVGDELIPNPNYRPSPRVLGLPAPANDLEDAIQRAATGYGTDEDVRVALGAATLFVEPGAPEGPELRAWTSDRYLPGPEVRRDWERSPVADLAGVLNDRALLLNPGTEMEAKLPAASLGTLT